MTTQDTLDTVNAFIKDVNIFKYLHDSYYDFITRLIVTYINNSNTIVVNIPTDQEYNIEINVKLYDPTLHSPQFTENDKTISRITPHECRLRKLNYNGSLYVKSDIEIFYTNSKSKISKYKNTETLLLCEMPIMVQSAFCVVNKSNKVQMKECELDYGGYFIINGNERIIVAQERMSHNEIYIFPTKNEYLTAEIKSNDPNNKLLTGFYLYFMNNKYSTYKIIRAEIQFLKRDVSLIVLLRALGLENNDIVTLICGDDNELKELMIGTLEDEYNVTKDEAYSIISKLVIQTDNEDYIQVAQNVLEKTLLPHLTDKLFEKAFLICKMARKLLNTSLQRIEYDDRDHYGNKRIDLVGDLLFLLFQRGYDRMYKELPLEILRIGKKKLSNLNIDPSLSLVSILNSEIISKEMLYAISTGNWGNTKTGASKSGVSQIAKRLNPIDMYSHLRRFITPSGKNTTTSKPRQLHLTQFFLMCPSETPEGQNCGFQKNGALLLHISHGYSIYIVELFLKELKLEPLTNFKNNINSYIIYINGIPLGYHNNCYEKLINAKRTGIIPCDTSIFRDDYNKYIKIWTDAGRCSFPTYTLTNNKLNATNEDFKKLKNNELTWNSFINRGYIEYLDAKECENAVICKDINELNNSYNYTHCIINPIALVGVACSIIPFADKQPSPRSSYQSNMGKQAIGIPSLSFFNQMDSQSHLLWYPQKKIGSTHQYDMLNLDTLPTGHQCIVAFLAYGSYNQEDGLIINKSAVDRGLFRSTYFKTYTDIEIKNNNYTEEVFQKSNDKRSYKLDDDGFIAPSTRVKEGDNIIDKVIINDDKNKNNPTDVNLIENAVVHKTMISTTNKGQKLVKTSLRITKVPEIGDKFEMRYAQKGVCAMMYNQEDMPFTADGIVPDIIVTCLSMPSRLTVGMLIENILGKSAAMTGNKFYTTLFQDINFDELDTVLKSFGLSPSGKETLYDGITGKMLKSKVYIGINHYEKLKHMVSEKFQTRSRGATTMLTRQPTEGRSNHGTLRFGEMETSLTVAQSCANMLREKLFLLSDKYKTWICKKCGLFTVYNKNKYCKVCDTNNCIVLIEIPYACKLLFQELLGMNIVSRIRIKE